MDVLIRQLASRNPNWSVIYSDIISKVEFSFQCKLTSATSSLTSASSQPPPPADGSFAFFFPLDISQHEFECLNVATLQMIHVTTIDFNN